MTKTILDIQTLNKNSVNVSLISKLTPFREMLGKMFSKAKYEDNMALKYENVGKNIFVNEFLYSVLAEIPSQVD